VTIDEAALWRAIAELRGDVSEVKDGLEAIKRNTAALVVEEHGDDGQTTVRARPAKIGLDLKTALSFVALLLGGGGLAPLIATIFH
jgi:hypothetical protein